jgi:putative ABC transport system permease protein
VLAGTYPAFFLSSFSPYRIFKGGKDNLSHKGRLRKVLVVLQFTISIFLITGTLIMYRQLIFMQNRDPGFNENQLLVLENAGALGNNINTFKEAISVIPGVIDVTSSSSVPGNIRSYMAYALEGKKDETILMWTNYVDYNFLETYGMTLQSGRSFSKEYLSDIQTCMVNEAAIKKFNIDPLKMSIMEYRDSGKMIAYPIIGVVKDFIFESRKNEIAPFIFMLKPEYESYGYITAKISPQNYTETISKIGAVWKEFTINEPLRHTFIDDIMKRLYIKERQNTLIAVIASLLAILIAGLGLYGLNSFTIEHRTKEIGVRKAMGSSVKGICLLIFNETIILVVISALISFPVIYYTSEKWLQNFYYRTEPGI